MFVTIGNGYGNSMVVSEEFYEKRRNEAYTKFMQEDNDAFEWHNCFCYEFEADLYEELLQKAIDEAEANC